jgi:hypothetical protein
VSVRDQHARPGLRGPGLPVLAPGCEGPADQHQRTDRARPRAPARPDRREQGRARVAFSRAGGRARGLGDPGRAGRTGRHRTPRSSPRPPPQPRPRWQRATQLASRSTVPISTGPRQTPTCGRPDARSRPMPQAASRAWWHVWCSRRFPSGAPPPQGHSPAAARARAERVVRVMVSDPSRPWIRVSASMFCPLRSASCAESQARVLAR